MIRNGGSPSYDSCSKAAAKYTKIHISSHKLKRLIRFDLEITGSFSKSITLSIFERLEISLGDFRCEVPNSVSCFLTLSFSFRSKRKNIRLRGLKTINGVLLQTACLLCSLNHVFDLIFLHSIDRESYSFRVNPISKNVT